MFVQGENLAKRTDNSYGNLRNKVKLLSLIGLDLLIESPYMLLNFIIDKCTNLDEIVYYYEDGSFKYRPSRLKKYLCSKLADCFKELDDPIREHLCREAAMGYDKTIKTHKWYKLFL